MQTLESLETTSEQPTISFINAIWLRDALDPSMWKIFSSVCASHKITKTI